MADGRLWTVAYKRKWRRDVRSLSLGSLSTAPSAILVDPPGRTAAGIAAPRQGPGGLTVARSRPVPQRSGAEATDSRPLRRHCRPAGGRVTMSRFPFHTSAIAEGL